MSEKPILFSGPMVRAILDGRKTMTRRVVKLPKWAAKLDSVGEDGYTLWCESADSGSICPALPRYLPGNLLWVRETWAPVSPDEEPRHLKDCKIEYRADTPNAKRAGGWDEAPDDPDAIRWRPSIYMPWWASRITLRVTAVKVERLQEISEDDAKAEGASFHDGRGIGHSGWRHDLKDVHADARSSFARLWKSINGPGSWDANPWVAAYSFERVKP